MSKWIVLLFVFACTLIMGCYQGIIIPEQGERGNVPTIEEESGHVRLDLTDDVPEVRYDSFLIRNPQDSRFRIYVAWNDSRHADWTVERKHTARDYDFHCYVVQEEMSVLAANVEELQKRYEETWNSNRNAFAFESEVRMFNGRKVVWFRERGRDPRDGRLILTEGFALLHPHEPDVLLEAKYVRTAFASEIEKYGMKELGELFLQSVIIPE